MNNELEVAIVDKINETYKESIKFSNGAKEFAMLAIKKAIECGQYLNEARTSCGSGRWAEWFRSHVTDFSIETAKRYMRLSEIPEDQLKDAYSLRQAYVAAGILDKPGNSPQGQRLDPDGVNWITALSQMTVKIEHIFDARPLSDWEQTEKEIFVERAKPIVKRYVEAGGTFVSL